MIVDGQRNTQMFHSDFRGSLVTEKDTSALALQLAEDVAGWLREGISKRGTATLVVSGGSTPAPFFSALSGKELDWEKVIVTLADERWVAPTDQLSNEKLIRETFMVNAASAAKFLSLYNGAPTPDDGWDDCDSAIRTLAQPYDVVVLGMGGDGHTASLFPDTEGLSAACDLTTDKLCWPMHPPHLEESRMSLTLAALLNCEQLVLHISGESKREVFNQTFEGSQLPIKRVIEAAQDKLQVYWAS